MTARPGTLQTSWNQGELSPELHGRSDLKQFYSGAATMRNVEPVPQGGFRLTAGTRKAGRVRGALATLTPSAVSYSLGPHSTPATVALFSFATPQPVSVVLLSGFSSTQPLSAALRVEWQHPGTGVWSALAPAFSSDSAARSRIAAARPGEPVTASAIRVQLIADSSPASTFAFSGVFLYSETAGVVPVRAKPFTFSRDQSYVAVFTPYHVDFWRNGVFVGAAAHSLAPDQIGRLVETQRFDTMIVCENDLQTTRLMRMGADHEWSWDVWPFQNVPQVDLGGSYSAVTDQWQLFISYPTSGAYANGVGIYVALTVNGEETPGVFVSGSPDWAAFALDLKNAIEALPSIGTGITYDISTGTGVTVINLYFTGTENNGNVFVVTSRVTNTPLAAATSVHTVVGDKGGEPLFSVSRGWPSACIFYQDRFLTGGFRARRGALLASVTGEYFDQNIDINAATGAILLNLDTDGAERIQRFARGRHLVIFTSDAEYFVADRQLQRGQPINIVECSRNGSAAEVPVLSSEGSLLYISKNRSLLYAATYSDVSQSYESEAVSLLASHLIETIRDAALQRASEETDADRTYYVRDDGLIAMGLLIRNQEVSAFVRRATDGAFRAVCVDGANVATFVVERMVDGAPVLFLERAEQGLFMDCVTQRTLGPAGTNVTGLQDYEGATVWAVADGFVQGPFTVTDGAITLPEAAVNVLIGRWIAPEMRTLPLPRDVGPRLVLRRPGRIHTVQLNIIGTTSIAIGANGLPARDQPLYRAGDPTDAPLAPVTRQISVTGLRGFTDAPQVTITQTHPGRLQVRDADIQARL